jgi:hypothetical protein
MIKHKLVKVGVATAAIAAAGVLIAPSAVAAAPHYRIHAGSHASGTANYSGHTIGRPGVHFTDGIVKMTCRSATANGVIKLGNNVAPAKLANIKRSTWKGCKGPGGLHLIVVQKQTWFLNGSGRTSAKGVTPGFINAVKAYVHAETASQCHFMVTGAVNENYANKTHHLNVKSAGKAHRLTISKVHGCFSLIHNRDHPTFRASYAIGSGRGPITIHSR